MCDFTRRKIEEFFSAKKWGDHDIFWENIRKFHFPKYKKFFKLEAGKFYFPKYKKVFQSGFF